MDDYTERLLERTRARSESLAKKMNQSQLSPCKRRAPLAEVNTAQDNGKQSEMNASPAKSAKQDDSVKPDTPAIPSVRSRMSRLADMRREWSAAEGKELDSPQNVPAPRPRAPQPEPEVVSVVPPSRKSRFAALAASISSWEDDIDHPRHQFQKEEPKTRKWERPKSVEEPSQEQPPPPKKDGILKTATPKKPARNVRFEEPEEEEEDDPISSGNGHGKAHIRSLPMDSPSKSGSSSDEQKIGATRFKAELRALPPGSPAKGNGSSSVKNVGASPARKRVQISLSREREPSQDEIQKLFAKEQEQQQQPTPKPRAPSAPSATVSTTTIIQLQQPKASNKRPAPQPPVQAIKKQAVESSVSITPATSSATTDVKAYFGRHKPTAAPPSTSTSSVEPRVSAMAKSIKDRLRQHQENWQCNDINTKIQEQRKKELQVIRQRWSHSSKSDSDADERPTEQRKKEMDSIRQKWSASSKSDSDVEEKPRPMPRVTVTHSIPENQEPDNEKIDNQMEISESTINTAMVESPTRESSSEEEIEEQNQETEIVAKKSKSSGSSGDEKRLTTPRRQIGESFVALKQEEAEAGPATPLAPPRPLRTNSKLLAEEEARAQQEALAKRSQSIPSQGTESGDNTADDADDEDDECDEADVTELDMTDVFGDIDDLLSEAEQAMGSDKEQAIGSDKEQPPKPAPAPRKAPVATPQPSSTQKPPSGLAARPHLHPATPRPHLYPATPQSGLAARPHLAPATPQSPNLYSIESFRKQSPKSPVASTSRTFIRSESGTVAAGQGVKPMVLKPIPIKEQIQTLMEEVSAQQSVIYQTSQALNLIMSNVEYKGSKQEVEAERLLIIAAQRRQACLAEIQRLKTPSLAREPSTVLTSNGEPMKPCKGFVTVQDLRLPLKTEYVLSINQDRMCHYFFLLLRCREHVLATRIQGTLDGIAGDCLPFTNIAKFNNLDSDFVIEVFVFEMQTKRPKTEDKTKQTFFSGLTPKKLLANITKESRQGAKMPSCPSPGGPGSVRASNFSLVGATRLTRQSSKVNRFTLAKVPFNSPLEGSVHLAMSCHTNTNVTASGWLTMFDDISGFGAWHRRWCVLGGGYISYWKYPDDEKRKAPNGTINLRQCITERVTSISRILCARPNTFELVTRQLDGNSKQHGKDTLVTKHEDSTVTTKHMLSADVKEDRIRWIDALNKTLLDLKTWNRDANRSGSSS